MQTQDIEYQINGRKFVGYLADGSNGKKTAGVLVAHEGGGMTGHPKERARMLAELGYVAFAMDTFGEAIESREQAMAVITSLSNDLATLRNRANTALELLKAQPNVDRMRTAAIGFCFGGTTVLELARSGADVKGVATFHGNLSTKMPAQKGALKAPILAMNGADDKFIPHEQIHGFYDEMRAAGADWQFVNFGGAVHCFAEPDEHNAVPGCNFNAAAYKRSVFLMHGFFNEAFAKK